MLKYLRHHLSTAALFLIPTIAQAQSYTPSNRVPIADGTMNTQVSGSGNNFNITGGQARGQTLFHSFTDFSVPTNGAANFINPTNPRDIITRVTGSNFSDINGLINSNGANFFLINPNGVTFGTNAQLNVGRAFMASTADGINLVDGTGRTFTFSKNGTGDSSLLSVNSNVLFNPSQLIMSGGNAQINNFGTLQTNNTSQYMGLIGGNVNLNGGKVIAPGGKIEMGGLATPGNIGWSEDRLLLTPNLTRSNIILTEDASISVAGGGGGNIGISAQNLSVLNGSEIAAGISQNAPNSQAGNITIDVSGNIDVGGNRRSVIRNEVERNAVGNSGKIEIKTDSLRVVDGAAITSSTSGIGNAGTMTVNARNITIDREIPRTNNNAPIPTGLFAQVEANATGNASDIILNTKTLSVSNGGKVQSATFGNGNSGNLFIKADDEINIFNSPNSNPGQLTNINTGVSFDIDRNKDSAGNSVIAQGNGGKLTIETNRLSIRNGVAISSNTTGIGNGGDISITAGNLEIINNSSISTDTSNIGNAGNIDIQTNGNIYASDNSKISSNTLFQGEAGKITIDTKGDITLNNRSSILSGIELTAQGNSKGIEIKNARNLTLSNNSTIQTDNAGGIGNAGNIDIKTTGNIKVIGADSQNPLLQNNPNLSGISSGISSSTFGKGDTGKITIDTTGDLILSTGGLISSAVVALTIQGFEFKGEGNSQGIEIKKSRNLILTNNGFISTNNVYAQGDAGDIVINSQGEVNLNKSGVLSGSIGQGKAANILINSTQLNLNKSFVSTNAFFGSGGNITVAISDLLLLRDNSGITTNSSSNGGNITIGNLTNRPLVVALPGNNDITANAIQGNGGTLTISSQGLFGIQYRPNKDQASPFTNDITASSDFGQSGTVNIDTPGTDPGQDSTELPNTTTDASNQISQACSANNRQNKLIVTGRGGLPPNADDPLTSDVVWQDARATSSQPAVSSAPNNSATLTPPAVGWVFDGKGKVTLIAAGTQAQTGTSVACPQEVN